MLKNIIDKECYEKFSPLTIFPAVVENSIQNMELCLVQGDHYL